MTFCGVGAYLILVEFVPLNLWRDDCKVGRCQAFGKVA
jgi:hypothetical protein